MPPPHFGYSIELSHKPREIRFLWMRPVLSSSAFDQSKYDELYRDIFARAIKDAGLKPPYRVDEDRLGTTYGPTGSMPTTSTRPHVNF
jgi:hypothetical protein